MAFGVSPPTIPPPVEEPTNFPIKEAVHKKIVKNGNVIQENRLINLEKCKYIKFGQKKGGSIDTPYFIEFVFLSNYSTIQLCESESNMFDELSVLCVCNNPCDCGGSGSGGYA